MTPRYHLNVFWSHDDGCWIADVPDLKYCSAHGDTPTEAVDEAQEAIALWVETARETGIPIPEAVYRPAIYAAKVA
jgi:predicted RNase H-like HicB family nuclease